MTYAEAIDYLQPIADSSSLKRYSVALNKAIDAMREMQRIEDMKPNYCPNCGAKMEG